ncbi:hypothetical protein ACFYV7_30795 [Nocardia suismassiliense]|uniref:Uncharacterized protein n=1 Tax=Nocardia suismassiliense TaxID=2077092 RepID=A0ABW6R116_9NOCA
MATEDAEWLEGQRWWEAQQLVDDWLGRAGIYRVADLVTLNEAEEKERSLANLVAKLREKSGTPPFVTPHEAKVVFGNPLLHEIVTDLLVQRQIALGELIARLSAQEQMAEIKDAVEARVEDPDVRQELSNLIESQQRELAAKIRDKDDQLAADVRRLVLQERRWQMRKSLLEREPAAVLIGGVLLMVIAVAVLIGMFTHTPIPEIVSSAFLLILGFFFGQTSSTGRSGEGVR